MQPVIGEVQDENKMLKYALQDKIAYKQVRNSIYFFSPLKYKNKTVAIIELNYSVERGNEFYSNIIELSKEKDTIRRDFFKNDGQN